MTLSTPENFHGSTFVCVSLSLTVSVKTCKCNVYINKQNKHINMKNIKGYKYINLEAYKYMNL